MEIITTADGSHSLRHSVLGELYHSDRGAVGEALHVFVGAGFDYAVRDGIKKISILEIGFGSGLNAWLTLKRAEEMGITVDYHAIELYPIDLEAASQLNFTDNELFMELHKTIWGKTEKLTESFDLTKHRCDFTKFDFSPLSEKFNLVYYDAFAPDTQPELWSEEMFRKIYSSMAAGGILTTYTSKGSVKDALRSVGFTIERLPGALGKRHMLRATK